VDCYAATQSRPERIPQGSIHLSASPKDQSTYVYSSAGLAAFAPDLELAASAELCRSAVDATREAAREVAAEPAPSPVAASCCRDHMSQYMPCFSSSSACLPTSTTSPCCGTQCRVYQQMCTWLVDPYRHCYREQIALQHFQSIDSFDHFVPGAQQSGLHP
jgi:hypothetical protein